MEYHIIDIEHYLRFKIYVICNKYGEVKRIREDY